MKICFLIDDFPPDKWTSSGILTLNLAKEMVKRNHQVFVITTVQQHNLSGESNFQGIKIYKIFTKYHSRWRAYFSLYNPQTVGKVKKILAVARPDICHFQHIHQYISYHCFKIAKKYSKAVFLTAHDLMLFYYGKLFPKNGNCLYQVSWWEQLKQEKLRYNHFRNLIIRRYSRYLSKIFCVSDLQQKILLFNGIKNVERIYNGIEVSNWKINFQAVELFKNKYNLKNKKVILFSGRLSGSKGGQVIIQAMNEVIKKFPTAILLVAGSKDDYGQPMVSLAESLKMGNNLIITGWLGRADLAQAIQSADICITPSLYCDPFPTVNLEAMACAKPIIGTCFGGTPEIVVDGQTGYIVDPNNIELMAEKILDLLSNTQKAKEFGEAGYRRVKENFSLERQAAETLAWYKKFVPNG